MIKAVQTIGLICFVASCSIQLAYSEPRVFLSDESLRLKQVKSGRYLDAYTTQFDQYRVVTREYQSDDRQRWSFERVGTVLTIQHRVNGRYLDAYTWGAYEVVTRLEGLDQPDDTQRWLSLIENRGPIGVLHKLQQLHNLRYLDAFPNQGSVVTRATNQTDNSQHWESFSNHHYFTIEDQIGQRLIQDSSIDYLDAYTQDNGYDYAVVMRAYQANNTQLWDSTIIGHVYKIKNKITDRYLDAYTTGDSRASTEEDKVLDNIQYWFVSDSGYTDNYGRIEYTIQQIKTRKVLDAYTSSTDWAAVMRDPLQDSTQRWTITNDSPSVIGF